MSQSRGSAGASHAERQAVMYCPYCAEETLFPLEGGGWECRSCWRAFSVTFLGLASAGRSAGRE
jgi:ribosomal protein L37AE/L43A